MKNYEKMVAANRQTGERKEHIAIEAMRKKYEAQELVTIAVLVEETGLSRGFFYKNEKVCTELKRIQKLQNGTESSKPEQQREVSRVKNYDKMVAVNRKASDRKECIAIEAMRKKYEAQEQISVAALVEETGLSRGFYYKNERVCTELRRLQRLQVGMDFTVTRKVVLDKAMALRVKELEKENRLLKMKIQALLDENSKLEKATQRRKEDYFNEL